MMFCLFVNDFDSRAVIWSVVPSSESCGTKAISLKSAKLDFTLYLLLGLIPMNLFVCLKPFLYPVVASELVLTFKWVLRYETVDGWTG